MDWVNVLENAIPVFTICGVFFLWLRQDNKRLEDKIDREIAQLRIDMTDQNERLRDDMTDQYERLREDMNARFDAMETRLRGVETEQARMAGLLEGLALTDRLPAREDAID
jgi:hypothetical protein